MIVWLVWVQGDDATWLEAAWDDETSIENATGWQETLDKARKTAAENRYEIRVQKVRVPGVYELFDIPEVEATADA